MAIILLRGHDSESALRENDSKMLNKSALLKGGIMSKSIILSLSLLLVLAVAGLVGASQRVVVGEMMTNTS